jgi:NADP-dependent 3-hydroxy acid dehydrogenase YdfG
MIEKILGFSRTSSNSVETTPREIENFTSMSTLDAAVACVSQMMTLNDGRIIPRVGLGVFRANPGDETYNAVKHAIKAGYRHVDSAAVSFGYDLSSSDH